MLPTLRPGQLLLGYRWGRARRGQIVVVQRESFVVKRMHHLTENGWWIEGDNKAHSNDSRTYGEVKYDQIEAIIIWRSSV
jgi:phage repressor protein C with HTH and peptisase S24 domain